MNIELVVRLRRVARIAYSRHPAARLFRGWRYFTTDPSGRAEHSVADILLLPLAGLALTLWLLGTVPGAGDAISLACSAECMP
jgi:hypothetical protein